MHPFVRAAFDRPPHLLTRRDAMGFGLNPRSVDGRVRAGEWLAIRRGIYAEAAHVETLVHRSQVQRLYDDAAAMATRLVHVRSHDSAAVVWDMPIPLADAPISHLTVPLPDTYRNAPQRSRFRNGVKHHLAPYDEHDRPTVVDGVPVLGRARTAVDLAREHGVAIGVCGMDAARRAGVSLAELAAVHERMGSWPHINAVRHAVELSDPGAQTLIETLARLLVQSLGQGRPETQFGLRDQRREAFVDLRLRRHLFEADGQLKYLPDGVSNRAPQEVLWEEKKRQDWLCGFKLGMSRLTWSDVWPLGQRHVQERLLRELADTDARFGTDISDLAPYVVAWQPRAA